MTSGRPSSLGDTESRSPAKRSPWVFLGTLRPAGAVGGSVGFAPGQAPSRGAPGGGRAGTVGGWFAGPSAVPGCSWGPSARAGTVGGSGGRPPRRQYPAGLLDGLEDTWVRRWEEQGTYRFDRTATRDRVYSIDTPPPTVSGALHVGSAFSFTHTDLIARFHRMRGKAVFYPMGWDDNGLPTERRVQNHFGVRCDPSLPYEPTGPAEPAWLQRPRAMSPAPDPARGLGQVLPECCPARSAAHLAARVHRVCAELTAADEKAFEEVWRRLGLSVDWSLTYATIDDASRAAAQRAFLRNLARREAYLAEAPGLWDVTFGTAVAQAELEERDWPGAWHRITFRGQGGEPIFVETTRPNCFPPA